MSDAKPVADTWEVGNAYERYVGRWSRHVAPRFLAWLGEPAGRRWLDVGCGTGALCGTILSACAPASVAGVEPSDGFRATARDHLGDAVALHKGSATAIPLGDASVDVVVSGLVLNFVADHRAALAEMARVVAPGGTIAAYVWDYAEGMQFMRHFWDAAIALDPRGPEVDEGRRFPVCRPEALRTLFEGQRLQRVDVTGLVIDTTFADFDDFWQPFLGGQGAAPAYLMALEAPAREAIRERIRAGLPVGDDGSIPLTARAWAVRGTVGSA
ncbi:MAG TPA: class I SAM-dependent methyltransferase [Casimicrobiaceae bacterium]|nr:class I SAM-dependent methyltransferase [Casimicrobiaceae bacterium]